MTDTGEPATLTIGRLADRVGVNVETVRYYERRGLLDSPDRSASGYRQYTPSDVERMELLFRAKALGFTLTEIGELVDAAGSGSPSDVVDAARRKLVDVEARAADWAVTGRRLRALVDTCEHGDQQACLSLRCGGARPTGGSR